MASTLIPCNGSGGGGSLLGDFHSGFFVIPASLTVTINVYKQMTVFGPFTLDGVLNIDGELILEP